MIGRNERSRRSFPVSADIAATLFVVFEDGMQLLKNPM